MSVCEIDWFSDSKPTPDSNPAVGRVRRKAFTLPATSTHRRMEFAAGPWLRICAEHAKRMDEPPLKGRWEWESEVPSDSGTEQPAAAE